MAADVAGMLGDEQLQQASLTFAGREKIGSGPWACRAA
jgi:hypothetical protein